MSFLKESRSGRPSSLVVDELDLDLTPIMNLFIILVPSLVSIAVFVHVAVIRADLPPASGRGAGPSVNELKMTIGLTTSSCTVSLGEVLLDSLPVNNGRYDFTRLEETLVRVRTKAKNRDDLVVAADDGVVFDDVVAAMDIGRQAGYSKLSLAGNGEAGNRP